MQIVSIGDNLHKMSNLVLWENMKNTSKYRMLKILPRVRCVKSNRHLLSLLCYQLDQD